MTDPWAPPDRAPTTSWPTAQAAPPPTPDAGTRTWAWLTTDVLVVGIAGLLVLGASSSVALTRQGKPDLAAAQAVLDQRLPALQEFVATERGLAFSRPVDAKVLDDEAFLDALFSGGEEDGGPDGDPDATLTALGLLDAGDNLDEVVDEALDGGVVGFYDNETSELFVRGTTIDPYVEMVLVHELTHALQDQVFDLDRPDLAKADDERFTGFQSLVEGDATRVETAFREAQSADTQRQIEQEERRRFAGSDREPSIVDVLLGFPYFSGAAYVDALLAAGGQARLDAAFRTPPTTTEQVLEPSDDDLEPVIVPTPTAPGKRVDQGVLGAAGLALLLPANPTQPGPHLSWDGDRYATFEDGKNTCTLVEVVLEDVPARDRLMTALTGWAGRTNGSVTATGDRGLRLRGCG